MDLIEIPLNSFRYHFRRLTWQEDMALKFSAKEDQRKIIMALALVDVSGLVVTREHAFAVLSESQKLSCGVSGY